MMVDIPCELCHRTDFEVVHEAVPEVLSNPSNTAADQRYSASSGDQMRDRVVRCKHCSLVFVSPRPSQDRIHEEYSDADNQLYTSQKEARLATFRDAAKKLMKHIPAKGNLLDVGCAAGYFLQAAKESGWNVTGIEMSKQLSDLARKEVQVPVFQGELQKVPLQEASFDVITFWDVLEHTYTPSLDLKHSFKLLKPGGHLLINYPAYDSLWSKCLGKRWWFMISVHLTYFTRKTIIAMVQQKGFTPIRFWTHYQKLELGYLIFRLRAYAPRLAGALAAIARFLRIEKTLIPYYASQITFLSQKP